MSSSTRLNPEARSFTPLMTKVSEPEVAQAQPKEDCRQRYRAAKARAASAPEPATTQPSGSSEKQVTLKQHNEPHHPCPARQPSPKKTEGAKQSNKNDKPRFLAPCGLWGCPVKAPHECRWFTINDPQLPSFIKILQARGHEATDIERAKLYRFFTAHKNANFPDENAFVPVVDARLNAYLPRTEEQNQTHYFYPDGPFPAFQENAIVQGQNGFAPVFEAPVNADLLGTEEQNRIPFFNPDDHFSAVHGNANVQGENGFAPVVDTHLNADLPGTEEQNRIPFCNPDDHFSALHGNANVQGENGFVPVVDTHPKADLPGTDNQNGIPRISAIHGNANVQGENDFVPAVDPRFHIYPRTGEQGWIHFINPNNHFFPAPDFWY